MAATTRKLRPAERLIFFTDAVVAIAMTLLILPLLDSVGEAGTEGLDTGRYLLEHGTQLFTFGLSFVIIAVFWRGHQRLFEHVERQDSPLLWLNMGWMFTIVWLPVATAMTGALRTDTAQLAVYIGTMLASSLLGLAIWAWLHAHPDLLAHGDPLDRDDATPQLVVAALFALALLLAVIVPGLGYSALLVMLLNPVLDRVLRRLRRS